jgi:hypothetical protein
MQRPFRTVRAAVVIALALAVTLAFASNALAAPSDPTLGLTDLAHMIDTSGSVPGHMKTVVERDVVVDMDVNVLAVTGAESPNSALILFEATDSRIASYGGIVSGMSGSPIYVQHEGEWKVVGALSYGDSMSLGGIGEATPIGSMVRIKQDYSPTMQRLSHPVITSNGAIDTIMVTNGDSSPPAATADGVAVVHPLKTPAFISGLPQNSRLFKRAEALFAKHGRSLINLTNRLGAAPAVGDQSFETTFVPGASIAVLESRGDLWFGGIGTVTYTDSDTVLAFGHPETQRGESDIFMSNAWIDGIWKNSYEPYKIGRPGALRGAITQDRGAGILGVTGQFPEETTVTARATNASTGVTTQTVAYVPRSVLCTVPTGDIWDEIAAEELAPVAASLAGANLFDQDHVPGSAQTTTTISVRDTDADETFTITMRNFVDDNYDIPTAIVWDAADAVSSLQGLLEDGVHHFEILSIELESNISTRRKSAKIVGVTAPSALKTGDNRVDVSLLAYGIEATQTISTTLTIPAGVSTTGMLTALASGSGVSQFPTSESESAATPPRASVTSIVKELNSALPGNYFTLRYAPVSTSNYYDEDDEGDSATPAASIVATAPTSWALSGSSFASPIRVVAALEDRVMSYGGYNFLMGEILDGPTDPGTISLYGTPVGSSVETLLGTTKATARTMEFGFDIEGLRQNTVLRIHLDGSPSEGYLPSDTFVTAYVRASMAFTTSSSSVKAGKKVTLSARVYPAANAGGKVVFERYYRGGWRSIATKTLASGSPAKASVSWKVPKGANKVRARFLGTSKSAATTSSVRNIRGR